MRVVMPLFQLSYSGDEFEFSDTRLSLRRFKVPVELDKAEILSAYHQRHIRSACWAIVADLDKVEEYKTDVSLLLMSFRLLSTDLTPVIRFRLPENLDNAEVLMEVAAFTDVDDRPNERYDTQKLTSIDKAYEYLRRTEKPSIRVKNALYFLYSAFHSTHWIHAFIFYMSALEALFSKDKPGGATNTICTRTSRFIDDPSIAKGDIEHLYHIRSRIVHGDIEAHPFPGDNLSELTKIENIVLLCFRKMIQTNGLDHYATKQQRDNYLSQFDI